MSTIDKHKETIRSVIANGSCRSDVDCVIDSIPFEDLQSLLRQYVESQTSPERVVKMVYATTPLPTIIGNDCVTHILEYLEWIELRKASGVNRTLNRMCIKLCDVRFDRLLLKSPVFREYFDDDWEGDDFSIGYFLQNKYDTQLLNTLDLGELGARGILKGQDMEVYQLCKHFDMDTQLVAWSKTGGDPHVTHCDFSDCDVDTEWDDWDIAECWTYHGKGIAHARVTVYRRGEPWESFAMCPIVIIQLEDKECMEERRSEVLERISGVNSST